MTRFQGFVRKNGPSVRRTVLLVLIFGVPLFFLWEVTNDAFNVPKLALLAIGVSLVTALRIGEGVLGAGWKGLSRLAVPAGLIFVPLLLSWLFTPYKGWSLFGQYTRYEGLVPYGLVIASGVLIADAFAGRAAQIARTFVASAAISGAYALIQALGLDPLDIRLADHSISSTVGHPNFLGGFLAMALPMALWLWATQEGSRLPGMVATVAITVGLIVTLSQGPWAAAISGTAVFAGLVIGKNRKRVATGGFLIAALVATLILGAVAYTQLDPATSLDLGTSRARGLWWRAATSMWADSPIVGAGPNVYAIESPQYRLPLDALGHENVLSDNPHSVFFSFLANAGLLGALGYLAVLMWVLQRSLRSRSATPVAQAFAGALIAYFIYSLAGLDEFLVAFVFWVALAGMSCATSPEDASYENSTNDPGPHSSGKKLAAASVVALLLLPGTVAWWAGRFVYADHLILDASHTDDSSPDSRDTFEQALDIRRASIYRQIYGDHLGRAAFNEGENGRPQLAEMRRAFDYLEDLPDVRGLGIYAHWLHQWSVFDLSTDMEAEEVYERLIALDPNNPRPRLALSEVLIHLGEPRDAIGVLQPALQLSRRFPQQAGRGSEIMATIALAHFQLGEEAAARRTFAQAIENADSLSCPLLLTQQLLDPRPLEPGTQLTLTLSFLCSRPMLELLPDHPGVADKEMAVTANRFG